MTLDFATFLIAPLRRWSKLHLGLPRAAPGPPVFRDGDVPDYLRRDLGLPPPERTGGPGFAARDRVTFF